MANGDTDLIQAMMRPELYPHPCEQVEICQTMMSWVLFAGQFAYKIKKPLRFPFYDATTAAKRCQLCADEVMLNRRLAPEVYIGVRCIVQRRHGYALTESLDGGDDVREFALVMRRLPSERTLQRMASDGTASASDIRTLAQTLAAFHASASIEKSRVWGSAQAVSRLIADNLSWAQNIAADSVTRESLAAVGASARRYLNAHQQSLDARMRNGRVREGHGDLRCDCVFFVADSPVILDCVEYSESLRYGDVISELASLAVDLDLAGRADLGYELMRAYSAETNDSHLAELLGLYKCYRAVLRGGLELLESLQTDLSTERRIAARDNARRLFALAETYMRSLFSNSVA